VTPLRPVDDSNASRAEAIREHVRRHLPDGFFECVEQLVHRRPDLEPGKLLQRHTHHVGRLVPHHEAFAAA